jgi:hypothetical protein
MALLGSTLNAIAAATSAPETTTPICRRKNDRERSMMQLGMPAVAASKHGELASCLKIKDESSANSQEAST